MAFMYDENFHKRSGRASLKKRVYSENALNVVKTPLRIFSTIQKDLQLEVLLKGSLY